MRLLLFLIFLLYSLANFAQPYRVWVDDLRSQWRIQRGPDWVAPGPGDSYQTIYFSLSSLTHRGHYLEVTAISPYSVWCNGSLVGKFKSTSSLSLDSLSGLHSSEMKFAIVAPGSAPFLKTSLVKFKPMPAEEELRYRTRPYFKNFSILTVLILSTYFLFLYQSNPRLILDYFNFAKLFSIQERDENLTAGRITSSINLVMYTFICLWLSFLLIAIFHFTPQNWVVAHLFSFSTEWWGLWVWLKLSTFLLIAIFSKLTLLFLSTRVFKFREAYATQALNFFRLLVLATVIFSLTVTVFFMMGITRPSYYVSLISIFAWILIGWVLLLFFKLLSKAPFTGFHLFFYLCASEIFPLVICFQALFF